MQVIEFIRSHALALPLLVKAAVAMAIIAGVPTLSRRVGLPAVVGLLLSGVVIGPHVLNLVGDKSPIADFFADIGKLLLMFFAGLEIDLALFRRVKQRAMTFGLITTTLPLILGTLVGVWFGYGVVTAIVLGSLLASHTLIAIPIMTKTGADRLEPFTVTVGATVLSDTLSLVVFAMCVSTFQHGFSLGGLTRQVIEIGVFIPLLLVVVGRVGGYALKKVEGDEQVHFVVMLLVMGCAVGLTQIVQLPGIVGAVLAGLSINEALQRTPAKEKLHFFADSLFIPIFFIVTGFLIDPVVFGRSVVDHFALAAAVIAALIVGKGVAAAAATRLYHYSRAAEMTMWSLTLPQVASTLAATLVGFDTVNAVGQRLITRELLDVVFVLILVTATLGPIMTQHYAPTMLSPAPPGRKKAA